jgi:hypothetical protein
MRLVAMKRLKQTLALNQLVERLSEERSAEERLKLRWFR